MHAIVDLAASVTEITEQGRRRVEVQAPHVSVRVFVGQDPEHREFAGQLLMGTREALDFANRVNGASA